MHHLLCRKLVRVKYDGKKKWKMKNGMPFISVYSTYVDDVS